MNIEKDYLNKINVLALIFITIYCISGVAFEIESSHKLIYALTRFITNLGFPLILMIYGTVLLKKHENPLKYIEKTFKQLIPSFIFWNIILGILIIYFNGLELFVCTITDINWFIWIFISNILVTPILSEYIHFEKENGIKYLLAMFIISSILLSLSIQFDFSLYFIDLVFFAEPLSFMVLGYYLDNKEFKMNSYRIFTLSFIILIIILFIRILLIINGIASWDMYFTQVFGTTLEISIDPFTIVELSAIFLMIKSYNCFKNNSLIKSYSNKAFSIILILGIFTLILSKLAIKLSWIKLSIFTTILFIIFIGILFFIGKRIHFKN